jgi:hypothetical protein
MEGWWGGATLCHTKMQQFYCYIFDKTFLLHTAAASAADHLIAIIIISAHKRKLA